MTTKNTATTVMEMRLMALMMMMKAVNNMANAKSQQKQWKTTTIAVKNLATTAMVTKKMANNGDGNKEDGLRCQGQERGWQKPAMATWQGSNGKGRQW